jgi:putative CocE/NonD family hydrolase
MLMTTHLRLSRLLRALAAGALPFGAAFAQTTPNPNAAYAAPRGQYQFTVERNVMVPMRDGVKLATDIYVPTDAGVAHAAIVMRTPYNKNPGGGAATFASHGYVVVVQDVRGKFASEGEFQVYGHDKTDWVDTFDWISKQSWSNQKIGSFGCSYLGEQQIIAMQQAHPLHLAAIAQAAGGNLGRVGRHRSFWGSVEGGANSISINFGWMPVWGSVDKGNRPLPAMDIAATLRTLPLIDLTDRIGSPSWDWRNFLQRSPDDPWWDAQGYLTADAKPTTAALHVSSWFDMANEMLEERAIFERNGANSRARENQYAIISPTTHCGSERASAETKVGDLEVGDARLHYWETYLAWFDRWLNGNQHALDSLPKIQYYTIGRNAWRSSNVWPVKGMTSTTFYLSSAKAANTSSGSGQLTTKQPVSQPADTIVYDPANAVPSRGGSICCTGNRKDVPGSFDQSDIERRGDVLVYTMDVPETGLELTGPINAAIALSSDALDTDVTLKLLDVFPDGRSMNIVEGISRARYRNSYGKPEMMKPNTVYEIPVDLHATSWYLPPGHKLRLDVSSSNFPRFDRNLNTGGKNYDETTWKTARNVVHHDAGHLSRLILPVVK